MVQDRDLKVTVSIRIPLWLRAKLTIAAYRDAQPPRSINAEIVRRLEASFPPEPPKEERT